MMRLLQRWWTHPADYAWATAYHRVNPILRHANVAVGLWCWLYALLCVVATQSPAAVPTGGERTYALVLAGAAVAIGVAWIRGPWPRKTSSRLFVACLEVSAAIMLLLIADPLAALPCAAAFGVIGSYIAAFHSPKMFLAHQCWSVAVVGVLFVEAIMRPQADVALAIAYLIMLTLVLFSAPVLTQALLLLLRGDAASAFYDPLTGLRNRRGLDTAVAELGAHAEVVTVLVVDLDNFKLVNDRFGHAHGDSVLRLTASAINEFFGSPSITARTGGEEFVIVAVGDAWAAMDQAHALRARLAEHDGTGATASIGMSRTTRLALVTDGIEDACHRADSAMYRAKQAGGNDVRFDDGAS